MIFFTILAVQYVTLVIADGKYIYQGAEYDKKQVKYFARGRITEFTNFEEWCDR